MEIGTMLDIESIAIGTGPSFFRLMNDLKYASLHVDLHDYFRANGVERIYGAGVVSAYVKNLSAYCYGDIGRVDFIPEKNSLYQHGCRCYATERNINDHPQLQKFPELPLRPEGSSGGMALSLACFESWSIGLIGFDCGSDVPQEFVEGIYRLIDYWKKEGRKLYQLTANNTWATI